MSPFLLILWTIVLLSFVAGYTFTNAIMLLEQEILNQPSKQPINPGLPPDEEEWRILLEKPKV